MNLKKKFLNNISQLPGWHTNRKIVIFESDDWGSIRMRSKESIRNLNNLGIKIEDPYNLYDSLASEEDLTFLFEVLKSFKDKNGNHPIITANTIVANPDFDQIRNVDFEEYHFELFTDTLNRYPKHSRSFEIWNEGIEEKIFHPQYHGREHVNIFRWLKELSNKESAAFKGFDHEVFGLRDKSKNIRESFMRALDFDKEQQLKILVDNIENGVKLFHKIFGFYSKSFIAPSYVWNKNIEEKLNALQVKYIQGITYQYIPKVDKKKYVKKIHYTGQKNQFNQIYLTRNAFFEPSLTNRKSIDDTLYRINLAFKWHKPAIIGTHRLNYIGFINENNRDVNLKLFKSLLQEILKKWPDVEFMTSDELGDNI